MKAMPLKLPFGAPLSDAEFHDRAIRNFWLAAIMVATAAMAAVVVFSPL
jgi:hypothetical protein